MSCEDNTHKAMTTKYRFAPSQWETSLQSNGVSHWLGANLESALKVPHTTSLPDTQDYIWGWNKNGGHFADNNCKYFFMDENYHILIHISLKL